MKGLKVQVVEALGLRVYACIGSKKEGCPFVGGPLVQNQGSQLVMHGGIYSVAPILQLSKLSSLPTGVTLPRPRGFVRSF